MQSEKSAAMYSIDCNATIRAYADYLVEQGFFLRGSTEIHAQDEDELRRLQNIVSADHLFGWTQGRGLCIHLTQFSVFPEGMAEWVANAAKVGCLRLTAVEYSGECPYGERMDASVRSVCEYPEDYLVMNNKEDGHG